MHANHLPIVPKAEAEVVRGRVLHLHALAVLESRYASSSAVMSGTYWEARSIKPERSRTFRC